VLRDREKSVLFVGGGAAALIFLVSFVILPDVGKIRTQTRALAQAEKDLSEFRATLPELRRLDVEVLRKAALVRSQGSSRESTLAQVTTLVESAGFPQSSFSMKSGGIKEGEYFKEESFDLKIDNRTYLEILRLIGKLEQGQLPIVVRSVNLKSRYENSAYLDAVLRIGFIVPR
jgi:hypothetical protein